MESCVSGAVKVPGAVTFGITNVPYAEDSYDPNWVPWGPETVFESTGNSQLIFPPEWKKRALLFSGTSHIDILPPTIDEAVGMTLCILDSNPGEPDMDGWNQYSEVSATFLPGPPAELNDNYGGPAGYSGEPINDWRLPCGTWRIRGYAYYDKTQTRHGILGTHPDSVDFMDYPESGRTWDSLPGQIRIEFWPEDSLRPRQDIFPPLEGRIAK